MYRLKLAPTLNLIIFLLCVVISEITDLYYVINKVIGRSVFYFFKYYESAGVSFEYITMYNWSVSFLTSDIPTAIVARYYIFRYFFFALQFIRLWIFKESYLFLIFHLFFTYSYLLTVTNK